MHVIIAGGGIGGLVAALCLHRAGIAVTVNEAVAEPRPLGLGINLQANAVRVLTDLGLGAELAGLGVETRELIYMNRHGQEIWRDPRGRFAGLPWPQYSLHRGQLQMLLLRAAVARLGADNVRTGRRLVAFSQEAGQVRAMFLDPNNNPAETVTGDVLVGADGIHSTVRAHFHPAEGPPKWNGVIMWRGATRAPAFLSGASMVWAGHAAQKFVCYPIARDGDDVLLNWICDLKQDDAALLKPEDWNREGRLEDFLPRYETWRFPFLDVPAIIRGADRVHEFPMVDRDPLPAWSHGQVTLLGDAAHPMYPIGSNGASQSVLDAEVLAGELARGGAGGNAAAALRRYDAERLPITARIVAANRRQGIDVMLDIAEARAPDGFTDIETVLPRAELEEIVGDYKRLALQDAATLRQLAGRAGR